MDDPAACHDGIHAVASAGCLGFTEGVWRVVGAVVRGPLHERHEKPGDDAMAVAVSDGALVCVLADGAGSARRGGLGAAMASRTMAEALARGMPGDEPLACRIAAAAESARSALVSLAGSEAELADFRTTLLGAVLQGRDGYFFNIGDGAGLAFGDEDAEGEMVLVEIATAEGGEYAGETVFLTDHDWRERLRLVRLRAVRAIGLMTDGVTPFALARGGLAPAPGFIRPVLAYLDRHEPARAAEALAALLDRPDARRVSGDDKSFLWAAPAAGTAVDAGAHR